MYSEITHQHKYTPASKKAQRTFFFSLHQEIFELCAFGKVRDQGLRVVTAFQTEW
jgi:hypothetical protein